MILNSRYHCFFVLNDKKLSSHIDQISEHINYSNQKIHSYDQMRKMIVNLGTKKCENNNKSTCQLSHLHNLLLMSIVDTPENDISKIDLEIRHEKSTHILNKVITNIVFLFNI